MSRKLNFIRAAIACAIIVLESLPYGAVLNFGEPRADGSIGFIRSTFSYFSLFPFGYANFGPLLTAVLSCVLTILIIVSLFRKKPTSNSATIVIATTALLTSLMPLMFGVAYYSLFGLGIILLLAAEIVIDSISAIKKI